MWPGCRLARVSSRPSTTACVRKISVTRALARLLKLRKMLRSQRRHRQQPALLQRDAENDRNWDGGSQVNDE